MNQVSLMGRLTRDPELRNLPNGTAVCSFTLAIDRRFKNANGERQADFINCVAWRQTAEHIVRYYNKGSRMALTGSIQSRSWEDQNGQRRYATEVIADSVYFADSVRDNQSSSGEYRSQNARTTVKPNEGSASFSTNFSDQDDFLPAPDDDTVMPFEL